MGWGLDSAGKMMTEEVGGMQEEALSPGGQAVSRNWEGGRKHFIWSLQKGSCSVDTLILAQ